MTKEQTALAYRIILKIIPQLGLLELVLLAGLITGVIAKFVLNIDSIIIIQWTLIGLAITFFLSSFKPNDIPFKEDDILGQKELLALIISPKVLWISCAISMFGVFVFTQQLEHDGCKRAVRIGGSSIFIVLVILIIAFVTGTKHLKFIVPILYRAIPTLLLDIYLFYY
jgi:hypothetical protein